MDIAAALTGASTGVTSSASGFIEVFATEIAFKDVGAAEPNNTRFIDTDGFIGGGVGDANGESRNEVADGTWA